MRHIGLFLAFIAIPFLNTYAAETKDKFVLVIDAGHGGKDPGAVNGKNQEKKINLDVALRMGQLIEQKHKDVKVIFTRKTDVFVELYKRAEIANKANADMFISIHTNSAKATAARGAETYLLGIEENRTSANLDVAMAENEVILLENDYDAHYEGYDPNSPESMIIFEFMQNEHQKESLKMASLVQNQMTGFAHRPDRGVHQAGYLVLWKSAMPSILVELGFISNADECRYLTSKDGTEKMAQSLVRAFDQYLEYYNQELSKAVQYGEDKGNSVTQPSVRTGEKNESDNQNSPAVKETGVSTSNPSAKIYRIQFMAVREKLDKNDKRLAGLPDVSYTENNGIIKYTCGETTDYDQAKNILKEVRKRYPDAFIINSGK